MRYADLRDDLKDGDVVLFDGKGPISNIIKFASGSDKSHVGMIVRPSADFVALFESTTISDVADIDSGTARRGVQIVPLSERLRRYEGRAVVRQLNKPLTKDMLSLLWEFRREVAGREYEKDVLELMATLLSERVRRALGVNEEDLSSLFCSELVAEAYQRMRLLADVDQGGRSSNDYEPKDFAERAGLLLRAGYTLDREIEITA